MSKTPCLNRRTDLFVRKFFYFSAIRTNQVMVCIVPKRFFVLGKLTSKLMFDNEFGFEKKFKSIVNSCQTNTVVILHHVK